MLAATAALIGLDVFTAPASAPYGPIALQLVYALVSMTATGLTFAAGIVGLIVAVRRASGAGSRRSCCRC